MNRKMLWICVTALAILLGKELSGWADTTASTRPSEPQLVRAMLSAVREPEPGQFPTPESVVQFFLTQVQHQDLDEATKAFAIAETYKQLDFVTATKFVAGVDLHNPVPQSPYHNLERAFEPLNCFETISIALTPMADGDLPESISGLSDDQLRKIADKFDRSRLADMKIVSIKADGGGAAPADDFYKVLGQTDLASVAAEVQTGLKPLKLQFQVAKSHGNWRIFGQTGG